MAARIFRVSRGILAAFFSVPRRGIGSAAAFALAVACSESTRRDSSSTNQALDAGVVALVGAEQISSAFVARVASARNLSPTAAGERALVDALFAEAARTHFDGTGVLGVSERAIYARALLEQLLEQARRAGPPSDAELEQLRADRWMDLDRPVSVQTAHAVVIPKTPDQDAAARALAERILAAISGVSEVEEFLKQANAIDTGELNTRVESLPHITDDGRAVYLDPLDPRRNRPQTFDRDFTRAAHAITNEGQTSPVTRTRFGYHVIFLVERVDAHRYDLDALRSKLTEDVHQARARRQLDTLLERLERDTRVQIARNADQLSEQVSGPR